MELYKDELLEYKRSAQDRPASSRQTNKQSTASRVRRSAHRPSKFGLPLLELQPVAPIPSASHGSGATAKPKVIPLQWQSTRAVAGSGMTSARSPRPAQLQPDWSANDLTLNLSVPEDEKRPVIVPQLNFSKLRNGTAAVEPRLEAEEGDEHVQKKKKNFEVTFQQQTRLAAMLRKKK
ncbi:hypothetical protein BBJ28_00022211 [Nothophytophthora sp. Chile5]|nr:hypothetical protein BBJ28_00022211 [Nothophytophthora sp. Chile5]